jgi:glycosyltransferase involved in cell wall biosynthesis
LASSGVGTQARWLINGLIATGKYSFRVFGGALKHESYEQQVINPDFIIKPTNGFGDKNLLRVTLAQVKPDAILLFTDPRFFMWVWEMEDEVHQVCPITYNHLWDNGPWPEFNRHIYESTDLINCINWPTYEMVKERYPDKTNYIPHAVPNDLYKPLPENEVINLKKNLLGEEKLDHFTMLYVSRNARRKMTGDILFSWKMFLDELKNKHGHSKATMIMHAEPRDPEGQNLYHVVDMLGIKQNIVFSKERIGFNEMAGLYNICDSIVNRSCNEGFGLGTLEAMMCGKPIIALKTGGLTRQVEDYRTGEQYGIALPVENRCLVGNQSVPYIFEDFVSHQTVANAYMQMYEMGPEKRKELGLKALKHAHEDYNLNNVISEWDRTLTNCIDNWKNNHKKWEKFEL